jgi:polar amino acid transport system substrate-binding protein
VLRVGLDPTYPPFESFDGTSLQGIDVDLAEAIAAEDDLVVEFSHFGFDGLYDALATEHVDVLISALAPDLSRTRDFAYSDGYIDSGLVLVSLAGSPLQDAKELAGKTVGVELGAAGHVEATTLERQVPEVTIDTYENSDAALDGVVSGEVDAAIVDNVTFRLYEPPGSSGGFYSTLITSEPYAAVVRREDGPLLAQINQSLDRIRESGELELIINRWLSN